ncbi:hypothetical protein SSPO_024520 [Streptomyces antimycoticus]|uniref:Uncharacterized protein n=1 Tax=Streptomyces antimycoticus TaxID=68175 RepID=A0A499UEI9_9ACTN|nr:hypothetical protein SSPO_024520 [Streptomyces antimycoticus]
MLRRGLCGGLGVVAPCAARLGGGFVRHLALDGTGTVFAGWVSSVIRAGAGWGPVRRGSGVWFCAASSW